jgi:hypothetical protein
LLAEDVDVDATGVAVDDDVTFAAGYGEVFDFYFVDVGR